MENVTYSEQKMQIVQSLLQIENKEVLNEIQFFLDKFLAEMKKPTESEKAINKSEKLTENAIDDIEDKYDATKASFEKWNEQFDDNRDLDTFLPEYGMTLKELRFKIYNAERSPSHPIEKFHEKLKAYV